jgi:hypothetical protein
VSHTHQYREARKIRKTKFVEDEYVERGCSVCGHHWAASALRTIAPPGGRSPIRLAHDDASYENNCATWWEVAHQVGA